MDREHGHRVGIRIEVGRGRIVAGLDQRLQVLCHEHRPVIRQEHGLRADEVEEASDVAEPLVRGRGGRRCQTRQEATVAQEGVEHLAGRSLVRHRREPVHVADQAMDGRPRRRCQSEDAGLPLELVHDRHHRPVAPPGRVDDRGQVVATEPVHLGRGERIEVDARIGVRDDPQERHQEAHLGSGVQPGRPGEPPRHAGDVQGAQDGVRVAVRTDEDRVVARVGTARDPARDVGRDPVRFLRSRGERLETHRRRRRVTSLCPEALDETRPRLEPIGVVEPDEPVRRVEDRAERAVVAAQDDGPGAWVARLEVEDVVDRGATERVDRLVVVADDSHVPVRLGEQRDELRLRAVRVLELVHQQVSEALSDRLPGGRASRARAAGPARPGRRSR